MFDQSIHWRTRTYINGVNTGVEVPNLLSGGSILASGSSDVTARIPPLLLIFSPPTPRVLLNDWDSDEEEELFCLG